MSDFDGWVFLPAETEGLSCPACWQRESDGYRVDARYVHPAAVAELLRDYHELLYQVSIKHPDETRHQTALRYLRNAESKQEHVCQAGATTRIGGAA